MIRSALCRPASRGAFALAVGLTVGCNQASSPAAAPPTNVEGREASSDDPNAPRPAARLPDRPRPSPAAPPRVLVDPNSTINVVWSGSASDAAIVGSRLVVLEPDGDHLDAVRWRDGDAQWRIPIPTGPGARLYGIGERLFVHERDRVIVIEAARGRTLGTQPAPVDGRGAYSHGAIETNGACAWLSTCGIGLFDCETGAPIGDYRASATVDYYGISDDPSEHSTSCSPWAELLGRGGDAIVIAATATATDPPGTTATEPSLIGVDATNGSARWTRPMSPDERPLGMTPDGTCWLLDEAARSLSALDCGSGATRWRHPVGPGQLTTHLLGEQLIVARHHDGRWRLSAYQGSQSRSVWSARLGRRQIPLLPAQPIEEAASMGIRRSYAIVDPPSGGVVGELVAGRDQQVWHDPNGGFVLTGVELRELGPRGRLARQRPFTGGRVHWLTADYLFTRDGDTVALYDRDQLRERARVEGGLRLEPEAGLPADRVLLRRYGEDGVAVVIGLDTDAR